MDNFKELQSYQPDYYKEIIEMIEILKSQGAVFDDIAAQNIIVRNNFAISTMDLTTTIRWEQFLNVTHEAMQTLEDRRHNIYNLLNPEKMSKTYIEKIFSRYATYIPSISFENSTIYIDYVESNDITRNLANIFKILNQRKPAHLGLLISTFTTWMQSEKTTGFINGSQTNERDFVLSDDFIFSEDFFLRDRIGHSNQSKLNEGEE